MPGIGTAAIGTESIGSTLARAVPVVTITSPDSTVTTPTVTVSWDYASSVGNPQVTFRAFLRTGGGAQTLEDSGTVTSASTTYAFEFLLQGSFQYQIEVRASDGVDTGVATVTFTSEQSEETDYPDEPAVGSVYEVAINGVGFMLADHPEGDLRYARRSVTLEPERFATGDTPFSQAVERYTLIGHNDWTGGAGQRLRSRPTSNPSRYWDSENVNPFEPGQLTLINAVGLDVASAYTNQLAVVAGTSLYILTGDTELTHVGEVGGAETPFTINAAAGIISSLASDGDYWYATDGSSIYRNNGAAGDPDPPWSTVNATEIAWCSDRLVGLNATASPPAVTTLDPTGNEEVASGRFTFPDASLQGLASGDGYMWWGVNRGRGGQVYAWKLGDDAAGSIIALSLPQGEVVQSLFFYLGNVFIASLVRGVANEEKTQIYRCVPSEGKLTPERVLTFDSGLAVQWAGRDRFVAFTWETMTEAGETGIGVIDLSTGGYAKWFSSGTTGAPAALAAWHGEFVFTVNGEGLYAVTDPDTYVSSGWLTTSSDDLESSVEKIFDRLKLNSKPLVGLIDVEWSSDTLESWNEVGTYSGDGSTVARFDLSLQIPKIGLRFTLTAGSSTPTLESAMIQLHPLSFADQLIILPLKCSDQIAGLNGQSIEGGHAGRGDELARWVESLVPSRVRLQDIDWPTTGEAIRAEAVSAETETTGVFDRNQNRRVTSHVVMLTLRRRL